jgi:hypothetical protein
MSELKTDAPPLAQYLVKCLSKWHEHNPNVTFNETLQALEFIRNKLTEIFIENHPNMDVPKW